VSGLRLSFLGAPLLEREGEPIRLDTRKNLALVAYLAVTGEAHTREALVTLLWPETGPSRAGAGLRRNLSVLKKALGHEWLVVDRESIGTDATVPVLTNGSSSRPRACVRSSPRPCSASCVALVRMVIMNLPSPMPGAGWRWIPCTSRFTAASCSCMPGRASAVRPCASMANVSVSFPRNWGFRRRKRPLSSTEPSRRNGICPYPNGLA
jgi:hypothetical protein